jgi:hypothetical protein
MIRNIVIAVILGATATASAHEPAAPAGHQSGEEAAVLAVMDRYLLAISAQDHAAIASLQTKDGMNYRARAVAGGGMEIVGRPSSYWAAPARQSASTLRERYWSPTVLIRGGIALVWAPYEFWIDGKTSHCGVDVFDFIKVEGRWLVSNSMWTVEPEGCAGLRPADASIIRPRDTASAAP